MRSFYWQLVEQVDEGECGVECKTIEKACQEVSFSSFIDLMIIILIVFEGKCRENLHSFGY
jgi:hypothetical protein